MAAVQRCFVEGSNALVMAECGNAFAWATHELQFQHPRRYRVSTGIGSMGHMTCGVVGAALASSKPAVAIVGDGSMLMLSEVSSAVQYRARAIWIVMNDEGYGMCRDGQRTLELSGAALDIPRVDFAAVARALGATATSVMYEEELDAALNAALRAEGPVVIDVAMRPGQPSPLMSRFESLKRQAAATPGKSGVIAGWDVR
jgi:acetolactate synthase-1/2/3 large subunit